MIADFDFDARLRARLEALDAAIPMSPPPVVAPTTARPRKRTRRLVPLLAAATLLVAATAVTAERLLYPDTPEPRLEAALGEVFADQNCLSAADARPAIQAKLDALGYADWDIVARPGADTAQCTAAGVLVTGHSVLLFPAAGRDLANALESLGAELLDRCLDRTDAMALVSSVLISRGVTDFAVRADPWGPQGGPIDLIDVYYAHVANGCFVYVGMGWDAGGKPEYYLWGPWP